MTTTPRIVSLNVGVPTTLAYRGKAIPTGIFKEPVDGPRSISAAGIAGDRQLDLSVHGGPDKAACVYPIEHFGYWAERLGKPFAAGAFGENLTVEGLTEDLVCLGDVYRIGSSLVQVSQPRQPCFKLATKHGNMKFALWVQESGKTGYYFRCLEPGEIAAGDQCALVDRPSPDVSILEMNRVMHRDRHDQDGIRRLLASPSLGAGWRGFLTKRLIGELEDLKARLEPDL